MHVLVNYTKEYSRMLMDIINILIIWRLSFCCINPVLHDILEKIAKQWFNNWNLVANLLFLCWWNVNVRVAGMHQTQVLWSDILQLNEGRRNLLKNYLKYLVPALFSSHPAKAVFGIDPWDKKIDEQNIPVLYWFWENEDPRFLQIGVARQTSIREDLILPPTCSVISGTH